MGTYTTFCCTGAPPPIWLTISDGTIQNSTCYCPNRARGLKRKSDPRLEQSHRSWGFHVVRDASNLMTSGAGECLGLSSDLVCRFSGIPRDGPSLRDEEYVLMLMARCWVCGGS